MEKSNKKKALILLIIFGLGVIVGYELLPTKIEIREKIVESKSEQSEKTRDRNIVKVRVTRPDGTTEIRTEISDKREERTEVESRIIKEAEKIITRESSVGVKFMTAVNIKDFSKPDYGVMIDKKLLGPFRIGVFGLTNKTFGATLGIDL